MVGQRFQSVISWLKSHRSAKCMTSHFQLRRIGRNTGLAQLSSCKMLDHCKFLLKRSICLSTKRVACACLHSTACHLPMLSNLMLKRWRRQYILYRSMMTFFGHCDFKPPDCLLCTKHREQTYSREAVSQT